MYQFYGSIKIANQRIYEPNTIQKNDKKYKPKKLYFFPYDRIRTKDIFMSKRRHFVVKSLQFNDSFKNPNSPSQFREIECKSINQMWSLSWNIFNCTEIVNSMMDINLEIIKYEPRFFHILYCFFCFGILKAELYKDFKTVKMPIPKISIYSMNPTVWKSTKKAITLKTFREINSLVSSLVKTLIWRKKCCFFRKNRDRVL